MQVLNWSRRYALQSYVKASLWIVPVVALILQQVLLRLALALEPATADWVPRWPLGVSGTLASLQAIIGLTTSFIIFTFGSLLVAIQIAGGQLTPRVIATTLLRDNVIRLTTGLFIFSLLFAIGTVSRIETGMPQLAAWISGILGIVSLGAFLYLIDHAARFLRPVSIFWQIANSGFAVIDAVYPDRLTGAERPPQPPNLGTPDRVLRHAAHSAVILAVDVAGLMAEAERCDGTIVVTAQVGDFVATGQSLYQLYGGAVSANDGRLRGAIAFGMERTIEQDSTFAFRVIVDIAVKALSKAINDPTTAVIAMDQLQRLLHEVGERNLRNEFHVAPGGGLRLVLPTPDWTDFVHLTCREIRQYGGDSLQVARRMRAMLLSLIETLPPQRHPALQRELDLLDQSNREHFRFEDDRQLAGIADTQGLGGAPSRRVDRLVKASGRPAEHDVGRAG